MDMTETNTDSNNLVAGSNMIWGTKQQHVELDIEASHSEIDIHVKMQIKAIVFTKKI